MTNHPKTTFSIDAVTRLTGLTPFTLRNWERRYGFPRPERKDNDFRAYTVDQVRQLKRISILLNQGYKISELVAMMESGKPLPEPTQLNFSSDHMRRLDILYGYLTNFELEKAEHALANMTVGLTPQQWLECVYQVLLERMGRDWLASDICIAQEHFASNFLRLRIIPLLATFTPDVVRAKSVVCTTLENDHHEGGLLLLSVHLKLRSWQVYHFGCSLPAQELQVAIQRIKPAAVCISSHNSATLEKSLDTLGALQVPVIVGGPGSHTLKHLKRVPENIVVMNMNGGEAADILSEMFSE